MFLWFFLLRFLSMYITQGKFEFNNLRFTDMPERGKCFKSNVFARNMSGNETIQL